MVDFKPVCAEDKALYDGYLHASPPRGCEFSFVNVYLWGKQNLAVSDGCLILLSYFGKTVVYSYPLGQGDKKAAIEAIIADSKERGIPCRINGMLPSEKEWLERLFPDRFEFNTTEASYDYVYDINALADLTGKKYHSKRNHINRFRQNNPDYTVEPISESNIKAVRDMAEEWFLNRECQVPESNFTMERTALDKLFMGFSKLDAEGLVLKKSENILAFTVGSRFYDNMFDVHFEKARWDADGAYPVINNEFAKHIRSKFPETLYLDREEDMGLEGLRQAKQSYHPVYRVQKWRAVLKGE